MMKACPFCGSADISTVIQPKGWLVQCRQCLGMKRSYDVRRSQSEVEWNQRPEDTLKQAVQKTVALLQKIMGMVEDCSFTTDLDKLSYDELHQLEDDLKPIFSPANALQFRINQAIYKKMKKENP